MGGGRKGGKDDARNIGKRRLGSPDTWANVQKRRRENDGDDPESNPGVEGNGVLLSKREGR